LSRKNCKTQNKKTADFLFLCYPDDGIARWVFGIDLDEFDLDFTIFKLGQSITIDF